MILFLASVIEQLDLALEHLKKGDAHNARFGLMLTDNALELVLHQIAKDKVSLLRFERWKREVYPQQSALDKALGRHFADKVLFARVTGSLTDEVATTVNIMHGFRNEVYHAGLQHEAILPAIALFHFEVATRYIGTYQPLFVGWRSDQALPERAKKYLALNFSGKSDFAKSCMVLSQTCGHNQADTIAILADHLDSVIDEQDTCIDIIANGVYENQRVTRAQAVVSCQTWPLAFSEKGRTYAAERAFSSNAVDLVEWLASNYPLKYRNDPVNRWRTQAKKLRNEANPHAALRRYQTFMDETAEIREAILESAEACETEIQNAIDRARGK